jgi:hypothetical protein
MLTNISRRISNSLIVLVAASAVLLPSSTRSAVFENGSIPQRIQNLRDQPIDSLTAEERAILVAADKVGNVRYCSGVGGNAFLIMYEGRPAIISTAHALFDSSSGGIKCSQADLEQQAVYYPNSSYYNPDDPQSNLSVYLRTVRLEMPVVNLKEAETRGIATDNNPNAHYDYIIMFVGQDITKDIMPLGHERGYLKYDENQDAAGNDLYTIGLGDDPQDKLAMLFQSGCNFNRTDVRINHDCATVDGSSGSLLGRLDSGEIVFSGLHRYAHGGDARLPGPSMQYEFMWNTGTSSQYIRSQQRQTSADF